MGFEGFFRKYQNTTVFLTLILGPVLFIIPYFDESCTKIGDFKCHEDDPGKFYMCTGHKSKTLMFCISGQHFNPSYNVCSWPCPNDCSAQIHKSKTTKLNDVGSTTETPTKSVVTTDERSSLISKLFPTTSEPSTLPQTTMKNNLTGPCLPEMCKLPNCKCPGPEIPGSLTKDTTPQIILLTFDDGVHDHNIEYYRNLFGSNLTNPNGCPIQATFFVSGDYTIYNDVKEMYDQGHEIASHSKTHKLPHDYWLNSDYKTYVDEIVGMKTWLHTKANIPKDDIRGMRTPYLAMGGKAQFDMLHAYRFHYDSTMVTGSLHTTKETPTWPFTLDYPVNKTYCALEKCPEESYPGLWEVPLIRWYNNRGEPCSMADACTVPQNSSVVLNYLTDNFNRHYKRNKAPFGICLHAPWLTKNLNPLKEFLEEVSRQDDVWIVSVSQALKWIQNPVPLNNISNFKSWNCK